MLVGLRPHNLEAEPVTNCKVEHICLTFLHLLIKKMVLSFPGLVRTVCAYTEHNKCPSLSLCSSLGKSFSVWINQDILRAEIFCQFSLSPKIFQRSFVCLCGPGAASDSTSFLKDPAWLHSVDVSSRKVRPNGKVSPPFSLCLHSFSPSLHACL